jgi:hypothetical protein
MVSEIVMMTQVSSRLIKEVAVWFNKEAGLSSLRHFKGSELKQS